MEHLTGIDEESSSQMKDNLLKLLGTGFLSQQDFQL